MLPAKSKVIKQLQNVYLCRDKTASGGNTTLTAQAVAGVSALTVAAITNFASGDLIRVGAGEQLELAVINGAPSGNTINLAQPLVNTHDIGDAVVEQTPYDLGDITDGGVTMTWAGPATDVNVATRRLIFTTLTGFVDASMEFTLPTFSLYGWLHATGMLLNKLVGAGTTASPFGVTTDGTDFSAEANMSLVAVGLTMDGSIVRIELWGVDMDYTGLQVQLSRGVLAGLPVKGLGSGGLVASSLPSFTGDTSIKPAKGKVWDGLTEVGTFVDTGTTTTLNGAVSAGATSVVVTSATGITAGSWIRIGSADTVEYHWVDNVSVNTLNLRTQVYRAQASGLAVVLVTPTPFAGTDDQGVKVNVAGEVQPMRSGTRRLSIGARPGNVKLAATIGLIDMTLNQFANALGIPAAAISGGRVPFGNNINTNTIPGLYVRGTLQDGTFVWVNFWGNSLDVSQVKTILTDTGQPGSLPLTVKPASGLQLLNHP